MKDEGIVSISVLSVDKNISPYFECTHFIKIICSIQHCALKYICLCWSEAQFLDNSQFVNVSSYHVVVLL